MSKTWIVGLPADDAEQLWPDLAPLYAKALKRTGADKDYSTDDILTLVKSQDMQCWFVHDRLRVVCAVITQILVYPQRKVLGVVLVGALPGTIKSWLDHIEVMKNFARDHGCTALRGWGRKGWERALNPDVVRVEFDIEV